jgi:hypothetical protein
MTSLSDRETALIAGVLSRHPEISAVKLSKNGTYTQRYFDPPAGMVEAPSPLEQTKSRQTGTQSRTEGNRK